MKTSDQIVETMKQSVEVFLVLLCVSLAVNDAIPLVRASEEKSGNSYECNQDGYLEYLNNWDVHHKASSRDTTSDEFKERFQYFIDNCKKIHEWNRQDKYKMEFTYYADWSLEEFEKLGSTTQRYSGIKSEIPATQPLFNNTNHSWMHPMTDPCDDILKEGENTLRATVNQPQSYSVSWAFAITNSIEYAVKEDV